MKMLSSNVTLLPETCMSPVALDFQPDAGCHEEGLEICPEEHPFEAHIFAAPAWTASANEPLIPWTDPPGECLFTWVATQTALDQALEELSREPVIAVDVEHHSVHSFRGFVCLIQISSRTRDFIFDSLALGIRLKSLESLFLNPSILKVMHGANQDMKWLQCDYGAYMLNLFDTGQCARLLELPSFGLAFATQHYCHVDVTAMKAQYQNCDWRQRPLSREQVQYARDDTHYLLYIHDCMRDELAQRGLLHKAQSCSQYVSMLLYEPPRAIGSDAVREFEERYKRALQHHELEPVENRRLCCATFVSLNSWRYEQAALQDESVDCIASLDWLFSASVQLPVQLSELHSLPGPAHVCTKAGDWGLEVLQLIGEKVDKFSVNNGSSEREVRETDPARLRQRQKQIALGKATKEYEDYCQRVPKSSRNRRHVKTPDPTVVRSKRAWDGLVKQWRRILHQYARDAGLE